MVKGRRLLSWAGILLLSGAASFYGIQAQGEKEPRQPAKTQAQGEKEPVPAAETGRPDLIKIGILADSQKLELPPSTFSHDKHTEALSKEKKDCTTCHLTSFTATAFTGRFYLSRGPGAGAREIYHANCIGCHMKDAAAGKKTGPLDGECRSCHNAQPQIAAVRLDAGFNLASHYRHIASKAIPVYQNYKDNCGRCHHQYDPKTKKTFYAQGKEDGCRDCHLAKEEKDVKSLEEADHQQCILCHIDLAKRGSKDNLPIDCAGCHGAKAQALDAKKNQEWVATLPDKEVPRLKKGTAGCGPDHPRPPVGGGQGRQTLLDGSGGLRPPGPREVQRHLPGLPPFFHGCLREVPHPDGGQGWKVRLLREGDALSVEPGELPGLP